MPALDPSTAGGSAVAVYSSASSCPGDRASAVEQLERRRGRRAACAPRGGEHVAGVEVGDDPGGGLGQRRRRDGRVDEHARLLQDVVAHGGAGARRRARCGERDEQREEQGHAAAPSAAACGHALRTGGRSAPA